MSNTKNEFFKVIEEVNRLREREKGIQELFCRSTDELARSFHFMLQNALEYGSNNCCLTIKTCPELYAKELEGMGFVVEPILNSSGILYGYYIKW